MSERMNDLYGLSEELAGARCTAARKAFLDALHSGTAAINIKDRADAYADAAVAKAVAHLIEINSLAPAFTHRFLHGPLHSGCNGCRR